jgi:hypothetical protein
MEKLHRSPMFHSEQKELSQVKSMNLRVPKRQVAERDECFSRRTLAASRVRVYSLVTAVLRRNSRSPDIRVRQN